MNTTQLKAAIIEKITRLESEPALLKIKEILLQFESDQLKDDDVLVKDNADYIFNKASGKYDNLLRNLAQ